MAKGYRACPHCSEQIAAAWAACPECGTPLRKRVTTTERPHPDFPARKQGRGRPRKADRQREQIQAILALSAAGFDANKITQLLGA
jgi:hypothetical protein